MGSSVAFKMSGFKEIQRELKQLPDKVQKRILTNSGMSAMRMARKEIIRAAPKGTEPFSKAHEKYGSLKNNIKISKSRPRSKEFFVKITTGDAFWGYFLEKGTIHIAPRPWFDPAFSKASGQVLDKFTSGVEGGIVKEWSKLR